MRFPRLKTDYRKRHPSLMQLVPFQAQISGIVWAQRDTCAARRKPETERVADASEAVLQVEEACLSATSTANAPWYVVPADDKKNARLIISQILLDTFNELEMAYPKTTAERRSELTSIRKQL